MLGTCNTIIPQKVDDEEVVLRTIFHPANFKKNKTTLSANFMIPPACPDENDSSILSNKLSVTRYLYAGLDFCKAHGKLHSNPAARRSYFGFALFIVGDLRKHNVEVESCPTEDNPAHANVVLPFHVKIGEPKPAKFSLMCRDLAASAKILYEHDEKGVELNDEHFSEYHLKGRCFLKNK